MADAKFCFVHNTMKTNDRLLGSLPLALESKSQQKDRSLSIFILKTQDFGLG